MVYYDILSLFFSFRSTLSGMEKIIQTLIQKDEKENLSEPESREGLLLLVTELKKSQNLDIAKSSLLLDKILKDNQCILSIPLDEFLKEENYSNMVVPNILIQENSIIGIRAYIYEVSVHIIRLLISEKLKITLEDLKTIFDSYLNRQGEKEDEEFARLFFNHFFDFQEKNNRPILLFSKFNQLESFYNQYESVKNLIISKMGNLELMKEKLAKLESQLNEKVKTGLYNEEMKDIYVNHNKKYFDSKLKEYESKLASQAQEFKNQKEEFERKLSNQKEEFERKLSDVNNLMKEKENNFVTLLNSERIKLEDRYNKSCNQITILKREIKRQNIQIEGLKANLQMEMTNNEWTQDNNKELKQKNEELAKNNEELKHENQNLSNALNKYKEKIRRYKNEIKNKNNLLERQKHLIFFYRRKNNRISTRIRRKINKIEKDIHSINTNVTYIRENGFFNIFNN